MPLYRESVDLTFTTEGDFLLGENGDIEDTTKRLYRSKIQQILTRLMSTRGDWRDQRDVGASLGEFLGRPNTRDSGDAIMSRVSSELSREALLSPTHLKVEVIPVGRSQVAILVMVTPPGSGQAMYISFTYDMAHNKLTPRNV